MRRRIYILFRVSSAGLLLLVLILGVAAYAGDEDMSPSAYHVFDPETGYMITVDPLDEEQQVSTVSDDLLPEVEKTAPGPWQYWIATIVVAGGIAFWLHKRRESHD